MTIQQVDAMGVGGTSRTGWVMGDAIDAPGLWHVLHTRSRQEKALACDLLAMDVPCLLPIVSCVRYYGRRKAKVEVPLFPGYVFLRGELDDAYRADRTRRVANIIRVPDQLGLEEELRCVHGALTLGAALDPHPYLRKGVRVEVRSGPFKGVRGVIEDRRHNRLALQVDVLGQASSLEIDGSLLDPIGQDEPMLVGA